MNIKLIVLIIVSTLLLCGYIFTLHMDRCGGYNRPCIRQPDIQPSITPIPIPTITSSKMEARGEVGKWEWSGPIGGKLYHEYLWNVSLMNTGTKTIYCKDGIITTLLYKSIPVFEEHLVINTPIYPGSDISVKSETYSAVDEHSHVPLTFVLECKNDGVTEHKFTDLIPSWDDLPNWYTEQRFILFL